MQWWHGHPNNARSAARKPHPADRMSLHAVPEEPEEDPFDQAVAEGRVIDPGADPVRHDEMVAFELRRLRARAAATELFMAEQAEKAKRQLKGTSRIVDGASFFLDIPATPPAIWGKGDDVVWALGESLMLAGPQGVGKTTMAGQLLRGAIGFDAEVLGFPMRAFKGRIGYLAMDRPAQAQRALGRMFNEEEREFLRDFVVVWNGPLLTDVAVDSDTLTRAAYEMDTECLFVDSLKDCAIGLAKDEVGAGYNRARQKALAEGVQLAELHHTVKNGADGGKPNNLGGVYGSTWLTAGAGSVVMLWGDAGDPVVELLHLKQPMSDVGPFKIQHNRETGISSVFHDEETDLVALARRVRAAGITAKDAAACMFQVVKPNAAQIQKAKRRLDKLVAESLLTFVPGSEGRGNPARWLAAAPDNWGEEHRDWSDRDAA